MPKPYQAVIFDMDGLIVDTENIYYNTYNQTLNELGIDIPREGVCALCWTSRGKQQRRRRQTVRLADPSRRLSRSLDDPI